VTKKQFCEALFASNLWRGIHDQFFSSSSPSKRETPFLLAFSLLSRSLSLSLSHKFFVESTTPKPPYPKLRLSLREHTRSAIVEGEHTRWNAGEPLTKVQPSKVKDPAKYRVKFSFLLDSLD
jgi:hypothetical protein